jgi:hypothetical protein
MLTYKDQTLILGFKTAHFLSASCNISLHSQAWWYVPESQLPGRGRQEDQEFQASLVKVNKTLSQKQTNKQTKE